MNKTPRKSLLIATPLLCLAIMVIQRAWAFTTSWPLSITTSAEIASGGSVVAVGDTLKITVSASHGTPEAHDETQAGTESWSVYTKGVTISQKADGSDAKAAVENTDYKFVGGSSASDNPHTFQIQLLTGGYFKASFSASDSVVAQNSQTGQTIADTGWSGNSDANPAVVNLTAVGISITGTAIRQDDPKSTTYQDLFGSAIGATLYGGSVDHTSDKVKLTAAITPADAPITLKWSTAGDTSYSPGTGTEWDFTVKPYLGKVTFTAQANQNNHIIANKDVTLGIRTDDVIRVGWIDPAGVPLSATGVEASVLLTFPITGASGYTYDTQGAFALSYLGYLAEYPSSVLEPLGEPPLVPSSYSFPFTYGWLPVLPVTTRLTTTDKTYILNWQFKYASNGTPAYNLTDDSGVDTFLADPTNYKLFNRLQIRYTANAAGTGFDFYKFLRKTTAIGTTHDPIFATLNPGQAGPYEGVSKSLSDRIHLMNDGSPTAVAVSGFNTCMWPIKWNDIGSLITEGIPYGTSGNLDQQVYPTYFNYKDYKKDTVNVQAANPSDNFSLITYPPNVAVAPWIIP